MVVPTMEQNSYLPLIQKAFGQISLLVRIDLNLLFLFLPVGAFPLSIIEYISGARSYFLYFFLGFLPIGSMVLVY